MAITNALLFAFLLLVTINAHRGHEQVPITADADWATKHMAEEHHIQSFDPDTFFKLHDFDNTGAWSRDDIVRMYGLAHSSTSHIAQSDKNSAVSDVLKLFDADKSETVSYAKFTIASAKGIRLPDFGFGPGHHGDDEYEYEIHHWEKYHSGDDVKEEDLTHPEDIEYFKKHEEDERRQEEWDKKSQSGAIIEDNIPKKFLREDL